MTMGSHRPCAVLLVCLTMAVGVRAAPNADSQAEIDTLIGRIAHSGCDFNRNGTWFDSTRAAAHLKAKFAALKAKAGTLSAEDFIEQAASRSSITGTAYLIRCAGTPIVTSSEWLRGQLGAQRAASGVP